MEKKFYQAQDNLEKENIPEYPSYVPCELRKNGKYKGFTELYEMALAAVVADNDLLPLLAGFTSVSCEIDLSEVERELKRYPPIKGDLFDVEEKQNNTSEVDLLGGFKSASLKNENAKGEKNTKGDKKLELNKECNVDEYIVERIKNEILDKTGDIGWDDIVGLNNVKKTINEIVLWPMLRPDIFKGLRGPPKGLLLFGPPGTGKTMIGKCIASQCKATFFSISASSLTSKWVGEGEKMVRALFYLARSMQPSVVFIDEIDSLLSQRSDNENEGSRRIKTEFLVQFDGAATSEEDKILVIGATNRPHEIDEAARRRLVKRIYVALPEEDARKQMVEQLITEYKNSLGEDELAEIAKITEGYSGSDIFNLCREASLEPLREIDNIKSFTADQTRPICVSDFRKAMCQIRRSVSQNDLSSYSDWNGKFGSIA